MAGSKRPYFPFYVNDFETDPVVEAMTTEQVGAYLLLLCKAWRETPQGSIPCDDATLARWTRLKPKRWAAIKSGILKAFKKTDGRFVQKRLTEESEKLAARAQVNADNGRLGGLKRTLSERGSETLANGSEFRLSEIQAYAGARAGSEYESGFGSGDSKPESQATDRGGGAGGGEIEPAAQLAGIWAFHCTRKRHGITQDTAADMLDDFRELMRHGLSFDAIQAALIDPKRHRDEYFWQFKKRLTGESNDRKSGGNMGPTSRVRPDVGKYENVGKKVNVSAPAASGTPDPAAAG